MLLELVAERIESWSDQQIANLVAAVITTSSLASMLRRKRSVALLGDVASVVRLARASVRSAEAPRDRAERVIHKVLVALGAPTKHKLFDR